MSRKQNKINMYDSIQNILENGENSFVEFKEVTVSPQSLADEITAFSNSRTGGQVYLGVADDGSPGADLDNLNLLKISSYFNDIYDIALKDMTRSEQEKLLINSCILNSINEKSYSTIAGLVFFSSQGSVFSALERYLPQAGIQFVAYEDNDMASILDRMDCYESYPGAIDAIVQKIRINWKTPSRIIGLKREEVSFPVKIFRELIVNAVIHRDYSLQSRIQVKMFPDRIEVITPGRLANTVTIEKMKAGISVPRKPYFNQIHAELPVR